MATGVQPSLDRAGWLAPLARPLGVRAAAELGVELGLLGLAVAVVVLAAGGWAVPVAGVLIATRQHGLRGLLHEVVHAGFVEDRTRSDAWCDLLLAGPIGTSVGGYRRAHLAEHRARLVAPPAERAPPGALLRGLMADLCGVTGARYAARCVRERFGRSARPIALRATVGWVAWVGLLAWAGGPVAVAAWLVPAVTLLPALVRLRRHVGSRPAGLGGVLWDLACPRAVPHVEAHRAWPSVRREGLAQLGRSSRAG